MSAQTVSKDPTISSERYRPRSVSFASWILVLQGLGFCGIGAVRIVAVYADLGDWYWLEEMARASSDRYANLVFGGTWALLGLLDLLAAIALWRVRSWAWVLAMTIQSLSLMATLVAYLQHQPNYISMAVAVVLVFILNQEEVQQTFRE